MFPQENFQSLRLFLVTSETKLSGLGKSRVACTLLLRTVNTSVKVCTCILYHKESFGDFVYVNSIVHEHIHSYMYVYLLEDIAQVLIHTYSMGTKEGVCLLPCAAQS